MSGRGVLGIVANRRSFAALAAAILTFAAPRPVTADMPGRTLPACEPDPQDEFGVDLNVNMSTIDSFLGIEGVVYRDMRLVSDPARYEQIGGDSSLSFIIEGFKVVPFPFIGTLPKLPVSGAYEGDRLFDVSWGEGMEVLDARPRYTQSLQAVEELFPKGRKTILMCGGGGYAAMTKALLTYLGWNPCDLYNAGGIWGYEGSRLVQLMSRDAAGRQEWYLWRADVVDLDFTTLVRM